MHVLIPISGAHRFIMKKTTDEELSEIRLGLKTKLEEITFADDLTLLSSRFKLA